MVPHPDSFDAHWQALRRHTDFSFGVVFVKQDWPRQTEPPGVDKDEIESRLSTLGYDLLDKYATEPDTMKPEEPPCDEQ